MNNGTPETDQAAARSRAMQRSAGDEELSRIKRELMQAEVRLARARATAAAAEVDVKLLSARLKSLASQ